jgi:hypothetical protein
MLPPFTSNLYAGVAVPMPTLPFARMAKSEAPVEEATVNGFVESTVVEPIAKLPEKNASAVEV